jgi:hypothetical protein
VVSAVFEEFVQEQIKISENDFDVFHRDHKVDIHPQSMSRKRQVIPFQVVPFGIQSPE